jgi:TPR repeat protein
MAVDLLQRAAAQRYAPAMANLGSMYADGIGVERDDVRAYALLHAALEIGVPTGLREVSHDQLSRVAARLNGKELPRAYQLSREISATATARVHLVLQR